MSKYGDTDAKACSTGACASPVPSMPCITEDHNVKDNSQDTSLLSTIDRVLSPSKDIAQNASAFQGKRVLLRADLNVPLDKRLTISDDSRARALLPTLRLLLDAQAKVVILSHLGRPKGGKFTPDFSLAPVAKWLQDQLGPDRFMGMGGPEVVGPEVSSLVDRLQPGQAILLENTRFHGGDEAGDAEFARQLAVLGDVYVNDAFGAAHRPHASVSVVAQYFPSERRFPGLLLRREIECISKALWKPQRPLACVVGGAKVQDKLGVLRELVGVSDKLLVGGRMAFTFLATLGVQVGDTVVERDLMGAAREILEEAKARGCEVLLPVDVVVGAHLEPGVDTSIVPLNTQCCTADSPCIAPGLVGGDVGPESSIVFRKALLDCRTVFWNGPLGRFETPEYSNGTRALAETMDELGSKGRALTVIGGGDSVSAVMQYGLDANITHISTGGGASLELIEGKHMPGIECLV